MISSLWGMEPVLMKLTDHMTTGWPAAKMLRMGHCPQLGGVCVVPAPDADHGQHHWEWWHTLELGECQGQNRRIVIPNSQHFLEMTFTLAQCVDTYCLCGQTQLAAREPGRHVAQGCRLMHIQRTHRSIFWPGSRQVPGQLLNNVNCVIAWLLRQQQLPLQHLNNFNQSLSQLTFYSTNIPSEAGLSGVTDKLVFNSNIDEAVP